MEFVLSNKGVCYDKDTEIITNCFGYHEGLVLKTFFGSDEDTDELIIPIYFMNETENILTKKRIDKIGCSSICPEIAAKSVCRQLSDVRKTFVKRSKNKKINVSFDFLSSNSDLEFHSKNVKLIEEALLEVGYEDITFLMCPNIQSSIIKDLMFNKPAEQQLKVYDQQRDDNIDWDTYFMGVANLAALRSKDPSTQVGACLVSPDNTIISVGYNAAPKGWDDDLFPWGREGEFHDTKYPLVIHSELNAIRHCAEGYKIPPGSKIYVTLFPCNQCAQLIRQWGIGEVIYACDKYKETNEVIASKRILDAGINGVIYREYCPEKFLTIKLGK